MLETSQGSSNIHFPLNSTDFPVELLSLQGHQDYWQCSIRASRLAQDFYFNEIL